jgi:hypothetical protein
VRHRLFRISAHLRFLATEDGGRRGPVADSCRPNCWFGLREDGEKLYNDCVVHLRPGRETYRKDGVLWVAPGGQCDADLVPLWPQHVREAVRPGFSFEVCEGHKVVALGTVTEVWDPGPQHDTDA